MKRYVLTFLCGALGWAAAWTLWHCYEDHVLIHRVVSALSQPAKPPAPEAKEAGK